MIQNLDVYLWNQKVGTLVAYTEQYASTACFYFDENYLRNGYDLAPLRASVKMESVWHGLPIYGESDKLFGGLPSFIADSLPDHWGNRVFSEWAKANHIRLRDITSLDRLAYIGRRGLGALEFLPPMAEAFENPFKVEIDSLYRLTQHALSDAKGFRADVNPDLLIESLFKVGTSAGGRKPKAIINMNMETKEFYSGQVATPLPGFTPMLIKFDEHEAIPSTRIEYSYYLMACAAGLNMMPSQLFQGESETHFLTERFDRRGDEKVHVQTLAAMNPSADSYEDLFDAAQRIGIVSSELQQIFLAMVLNVVAGNVDDHNKNFSFMMAKDGIWHVAPTYDFTFTVDLDAPGYVNRHSMTLNGKNSHIERADLLEVARKYDIKGAETLIREAVETVRDYPTYAAQAGVGAQWTAIIQEEMTQRIDLLEL